MAYTFSNKCAKNVCKPTVLVQLIIKYVVTVPGPALFLMRPCLSWQCTYPPVASMAHSIHRNIISGFWNFFRVSSFIPMHAVCIQLLHRSHRMHVVEVVSCRHSGHGKRGVFFDMIDQWRFQAHTHMCAIRAMLRVWDTNVIKPLCQLSPDRLVLITGPGPVKWTSIGKLIRHVSAFISMPLNLGRKPLAAYWLIAVSQWVALTEGGESRSRSGVSKYYIGSVGTRYGSYQRRRLVRRVAAVNWH